jgi:hypothetical protein
MAFMFSQEEIDRMKQTFSEVWPLSAVVSMIAGVLTGKMQFDKDGSGSISVEELGTVMAQLGEAVSAMKLRELIAEVDTDQNGEVDFSEFLTVGCRRLSQLSWCSSREWMCAMTDDGQLEARTEEGIQRSGQEGGDCAEARRCFPELGCGHDSLVLGGGEGVCVCVCM